MSKDKVSKYKYNKFENNYDSDILKDLTESILIFKVKCKYDSEKEILDNIKLKMIYTEKGIVIMYKYNVVKELSYNIIKSWRLEDNIFSINLENSKYIFKIKENKAKYCNIAMGYFTHKMAYYDLIEKNRLIENI